MTLSEILSEIIGLIVKWFVPVVCGAIFGAGVTLIKNARKRDKALEAGIQCLLRAELIRMHKEYKRKGHCPIYARESFIKMYAAYAGLGGNDVVTDLKKDVLELPTEEPAQKTE